LERITVLTVRAVNFQEGLNVAEYALQLHETPHVPTLSDQPKRYEEVASIKMAGHRTGTPDQITAASVSDQLISIPPNLVPLIDVTFSAPTGYFANNLVTSLSRLARA
jgi:hypothetical protein